MFFNSTFKKIFLAVALCCTSFTVKCMHSNWFLPIIAPLKLGLTAVDALTPIDNEPIKAQYPYTYNFIQKELKSMGIDSSKIRFQNTSNVNFPGNGSVSYFRSIVLKFNEFESILRKKNEGHQLTTQEAIKINWIRYTIAHEMGHITHYSLPLMGLVGIATFACAQKAASCFTQTWYSKLFWGYMCSIPILITFKHIDEHRADSYAIQQLKAEPQILIDSAQAFMSFNTSEYAFNYLSSESQRSRIFLNNIYSWIHDTHGSHIARANHLLRGAGIQKNQIELLQESDRQRRKYDTPSWLESLRKSLCFWRQRKPFQFDMTPILATSEKNKKLAAERAERVREWDELLTLGGYPE